MAAMGKLYFYSIRARVPAVSQRSVRGIEILNWPPIPLSHLLLTNVMLTPADESTPADETIITFWSAR